jgi:hypothetical protein
VLFDVEPAHLRAVGGAGSFAAETVPHASQRVWDTPYEERDDSSVPFQNSLQAALRYYTEQCARLLDSHRLNIEASTVDEASDVLEQTIRRSWQQFRSARAFTSGIRIRMYV